MAEDSMLNVWAQALDERTAIENFWDWLAEKRAGEPGVQFHDLHIGKLLDEYHGIDQKQLDRERRELLKAYQDSGTHHSESDEHCTAGEGARAPVEGGAA